MLKPIIAISALFLITACQSVSTGMSGFPQVDLSKETWSDTELVQDIAVHHLARDNHSSSHLIRLMGKETPHYHDSHDLSIKVLTGQSVVHFQDRALILDVGDTLFVPKGSLHWAENIASKENIVVVVFSPAYSGKDKRDAD